jgi:putative toxin-antitoxin system antitoxin component (TIGR02293 family)
MTFITPEQIASVMALVNIPHSFAELDELVSHGLPKNALKASVDRVCKNAEDRKHLLYRIIPEATYKRRRDKLSAEESGRAERLARVYATARYVWNSDNDAQSFLQTPHPMLQSQTPLDVSMTELGARRVEDLLWKLYYGIAA